MRVIAAAFGNPGCFSFAQFNDGEVLDIGKYPPKCNAPIKQIPITTKLSVGSENT